MSPDQQLIDVLTASGEVCSIPFSNIVWATPRKFIFQFTANQEIKVKGILGGLSGAISITGFKMSHSVGKYTGQYLGSATALLVTGTGITFTGIIVGSTQAVITRNLIEHYTKINFNEYALQNRGRVFINNQDQFEMLPLQTSVSQSASAFFIKVKVRKIIASILSFGLVSSLYHLIGEEVPGTVNTNLKGRKLLIFWLVGKFFPKSVIRNRLGLATNFSINFEYALLSTLSTIIIIKTLTIIHQNFYAKPE
jgi:hypothetical protein